MVKSNSVPQRSLCFALVGIILSTLSKDYPKINLLIEIRGDVTCLNGNYFKTDTLKADKKKKSSEETVKKEVIYCCMGSVKVMCS